MKSYSIVLIALLMALAIFLPLLITGCTNSKYKIQQYPPARTSFEYTVIDNLHLSEMDESLLANSDRGFRGEVYYTLGTEKAYPGDEQNYLDCVNEQLELYKNDKINILQCYIYLTEYRDRDLNETALSQMKKYFEMFKSKNIRILLRFAYEYTSSANYDAKDGQIIKHLSQIKSFINNNSKLFNDVVYAMQLGLIGLWGEGHGYHYHHNIKKLITKLCEAIPEDIYIMVRTPDILSQVPKKYEHRFSVHDDFLVGMDHKWGMMSWNDPQYQDLLNKNQYAIADGEMPWGRDTTVPVIDPIGFLKQVIGYGLTSLSITHNYIEDLKEKDIVYHLEKWKTEYLTKSQLDKNNIPYLDSMLEKNQISIYNYLQYHLGYNLGVSNLLQTNGKTSFMINNFGIASPFEYKLEIIADGQNIEVEQIQLGRFGQQIVLIDKNVKEIKIKFIHRRTGETIKLANNLPYLDGYNVINL